MATGYKSGSSHSAQDRTKPIQTPNGLKVTLHLCDITGLVGDAIVSGEGEHFKGWSAVSKRLLELGGSSYESGKKSLTIANKLFEQGRVYKQKVETPSKIHHSYVLHAIVPNYEKCTPSEWETLMKKLLNSIMTEARRLKLKTITMPLIGSGKGKAPLEKTASVVMEYIFKQKKTIVEEIQLVTLDDVAFAFLESNCDKFTGPSVKPLVNPASTGTANRPRGRGPPKSDSTAERNPAGRGKGSRPERNASQDVRTNPNKSEHQPADLKIMGSNDTSKSKASQARPKSRGESQQALNHNPNTQSIKSAGKQDGLSNSHRKPEIPSHNSKDTHQSSFQIHGKRISSEVSKCKPVTKDFPLEPAVNEAQENIPTKKAKFIDNKVITQDSHSSISQSQDIKGKKENGKPCFSSTGTDTEQQKHLKSGSTAGGGGENKLHASKPNNETASVKSLAMHDKKNGSPPPRSASQVDKLAVILTSLSVDGKDSGSPSTRSSSQGDDVVVGLKSLQVSNTKNSSPQSPSTSQDDQGELTNPVITSAVNHEARRRRRMNNGTTSQDGHDKGVQKEKADHGPAIKTDAPADAEDDDNGGADDNTDHIDNQHAADNHDGDHDDNDDIILSESNQDAARGKTNTHNSRQDKNPAENTSTHLQNDDAESRLKNENDGVAKPTEDNSELQNDAARAKEDNSDLQIDAARAKEDNIKNSDPKLKELKTKEDGKPHSTESSNSVTKTDNKQDTKESHYHDNSKQEKDEKQKHKAISEDGTKEMCVICMEEIKDPKKLDKCGHVFCRSCITDCFEKFKPVCPTCNMVYGVVRGTQPEEGTMNVTNNSGSLPGYPECGMIIIDYVFHDGVQTEEHPKPGSSYHGTRRTAFLPKNMEGRTICKLLRVAFDRRLVFTIGRSSTTGREDVVTWNDIHHKTRIDGGPTRFGYPDPDYLRRVREELTSKGVTESDLRK
ncbi:uncharacterized protein DDB_G0290685-like [Gigantopelta aegis]|uniref:uncharacterized protein DDB_G0290685-like n=1 Tax=Gigantopelta aegis TaxID=1735272 RepID=UPI001B88DBAC|nr:uncharacterized protein DDB_G0290685-like [Gigantopelta aegis]